MTVATYKTAGNYPKALNLRESKVVEAARNGLAISGSIVNADISASAEIAVSKLADGTAYQVIQTDAAGTGVEWTTLTNNNIDAAAAIAITKLAIGTADYVLKTNVGGTANEFGQIVNASVANAAAIAITKLAIGTADQVLKTNTGGTANEFGKLADANIATTAAIAVSKLAFGTANYVVKTNAAGNAVESGQIVDASVDAAAAIARTKIASGTNDHVIINSGAGALSSEAQLATSRGGTGVNSTATFPASGTVAITSQIFNFYKIDVDVSTIDISAGDNSGLFGTAIPINAHVLGVSTQVLTILNGNVDDTATVKIGLEDQDDDIFIAAAVSGAPWSTTGKKANTGAASSILFNDITTSITCSAARQIKVTITRNNDTAMTGTLSIWVHYIV